MLNDSSGDPGPNGGFRAGGYGGKGSGAGGLWGRCGTQPGRAFRCHSGGDLWGWAGNGRFMAPFELRLYGKLLDYNTNTLKEPRLPLLEATINGTLKAGGGLACTLEIEMATRTWATSCMRRDM